MAVSATSSIITQLGSGSGIDVGTLVPQLVEAQFSVQTKRLAAKAETLTAQISSVSKLKSAITGFDAALKSLVKGGTLTTQPASSNPATLRVSALPGATLGTLAGSVEVRRLAQAQAATTRTPVPATAAFATGRLTIALGTEMTANGQTDFAAADSFEVEVGADDATLAGVAARINAANRGVTAAVVTDGGGVRLQLKGPSGAAGAFRVTGADDAGAGGISLSTLDVSRDPASPVAIGADARDAVLVLDGAEFRRAANSVSDLVAGVRLDLAAPGTAALTSAAPTTAVGRAVQDFADTYNEMLSVLKEETNALTGPLKGEAAAASLMAGLKRLTTAVLNPGAAAGTPRALADLGLATARDGTLSVDATRLAAAVARYPGEVESMFAEGRGLPAAMGQLATGASSNVYGLAAAAGRYAKLQAQNAAAQTALTAQSDAARTRLTRQYAAMDARVAAYKATQTFMENQVKAWNKSDS